MKCEHCGRNDATFYYRSNVNGQVSEAHLCEACAETLGFRAGMSDAWENLFSFLPRAAGGEGLFAPVLTPAARRTLRVLPAEEEHIEPLLSAEEQRSLRRQREKNALEVALRQALEREDYEQAAKLRDELNRLQ